jgi:hypothetical protein
MTDNANNDPIGKALGLPPMVSNASSTINDLLITSHDDSAKADFEKARSNIHAMIENGADAMHKLAQIADSSQHPRAFEVVGGLIKTLVDANKDLLDIQKKLKDLKKSDDPKPKSITAMPVWANVRYSVC